MVTLNIPGLTKVIIDMIIHHHKVLKSIVIKLLPIVEFTFNNAKDTNTGHISVELICGYHFRFVFKEDVNFCSRSYAVDKLANELKELMEICC